MEVNIFIKMRFKAFRIFKAANNRDFLWHPSFFALIKVWEIYGGMFRTSIATVSCR